MKKIIMYTGPLCNFCDAAKRLLVRNNIPYEEINIALDTEQRDIMLKISNGKVLPLSDESVAGF